MYTNSILTGRSEIKPAQKPKSDLWKRIIQYKYFYVLFFPAVVFYIVFSYVPMYGTILAFKEFSFPRGL